MRVARPTDSLPHRSVSIHAYLPADNYKQLQLLLLLLLLLL